MAQLRPVLHPKFYIQAEAVVDRPVNFPQANKRYRSSIAPPTSGGSDAEPVVTEPAGIAPLPSTRVRRRVARTSQGVVAASMNDLPEAMAENFLKALGSLGKAAAPVLQRAAPAIAQGALSGASVGGPWGALIGAGAGAASSALGGAKRAPAAAPPAGMAPPAAAAPLPTGQPAAATLVSLLQNPTVQKALMSQVFRLRHAASHDGNRRHLAARRDQRIAHAAARKRLRRPGRIRGPPARSAASPSTPRSGSTPWTPRCAPPWATPSTPRCAPRWRMPFGRSMPTRRCASSH